jgi:hypothetical protein
MLLYNALCFECVCTSRTVYRGVTRGCLGVQPPPPEIPKFWQSWAKFPVPWNIHPQQRNQNTGFISFSNWVEPLTRGLPPLDPRSLCPLSSTEFVDPRTKNPRYATDCRCHKQQSCNSPYTWHSPALRQTPPPPSGTIACAAICILTSCCKVEKVSERFTIVDPTVASTRARFAPH